MREEDLEEAVAAIEFERIGILEEAAVLLSSAELRKSKGSGTQILEERRLRQPIWAEQGWWYLDVGEADLGVAATVKYGGSEG